MVNFIQRATQREHHRKQDETITHAKDDDSKPHFEEWNEDVTFAWRQDHDRQECWESTVEYWRAHLAKSFLGFKLSLFKVTQRLAIVPCLRWIDL